MSVSSVMAVKNCLVLKDQDCAVRKVIIDNDYMTFPYKIKVGKCIGSCNGVENPYFKVCLPDAVNSRSNIKEKCVKNISLHQSYKCGCLLDKKFVKTNQSEMKKV